MNEAIRNASVHLHAAYSALSEALEHASTHKHPHASGLMDAQNAVNAALSHVEPMVAKLPEPEAKVEEPQATEEKDDGTGSKPARGHR